MEEKLLHAEEEEVEKNLPFLTRENLNSSPAAVSFDTAKLNLLRGSFGLCKDEKLKSQKNIEQLFKIWLFIDDVADDHHSLTNHDCYIIYIYALSS